jgi:hypothetical protein
MNLVGTPFKKHIGAPLPLSVVSSLCNFGRFPVLSQERHHNISRLICIVQDRRARIGNPKSFAQYQGEFCVVIIAAPENFSIKIY